MTNVISFISDYYFIFVIITIILINALVGYFVSQKRQKSSPFKIENNQNANIINEGLNMNINNNMSLQEIVNENAQYKNNK